MTWGIRRGRPALATAVALTALGAGIAQGALGDLTQSAGPKGCLADDDGQGCRVAKSPRGSELATSPDGRHLYVTSSGSITTLEITRDGSLRQSPKRHSCLSDFYEPCRPNALGGDFLSGGIAIAPDGRNAYVLSGAAGAEGVLAFKRDRKTGALRQLKGKAGCLTAQGRSDDDDPATAGDCADAPTLSNVASIAIAPDGRDVYVGGGFTSQAIFSLDRNKRSGRLSQRSGEGGCVSSAIVACRDSIATNLIAALTFDSKGRQLYAAAHNSGGIGIFDRAKNGALTQKQGAAGCVTNSGAGDCVDGRGLATTRDVAVSPDDRNVYAVARGSSALTTFGRNLQTGTIQQLPGANGCLVETATAAIPNCADALVLGVADDIAVSRDGRSVYALADGFFADNLAHGIGVFRRGPQTGVLSQPDVPNACFSQDGFSDPDVPGTAGECRTGRMFGPFGELVLAPGDGSLYSNDTNEGIDILKRKAQPCAGKRVTLMGTPLKDSLVGSDGKDVIAGLDGNDRIRGLSGRDVICGGKGKDRIDGGAGKDRCRGDSGRDRLRACEKSG